MKSGIFVNSDQGKIDIFDLTDEQFACLLANELSRFDGRKKISDELQFQLVKKYLISSKRDGKEIARTTVMLMLEEMGVRWKREEKQWKKCLAALEVNLVDLHSSE